MLRKFLAIGLVGLFLTVLIVTAEDSTEPYNPTADINKDGIVDILDLVEVGQAYGSNYTLMHQINKTTVTVLSHENNNFSYAENALVAVFPQIRIMEGQWKYTNSSGTVAFDLGANSSYIAIAWKEDRSTYNYANFTTNSLGEASVAIWLSNYAASSPIRNIPKGWIVITILDNVTGKPYVYEYEPNQYDQLFLYGRSFTLIFDPNEVLVWTSDLTLLSGTYTGILAIDSSKDNRPITIPNVNVCLQADAWYPGNSRPYVVNCTYRTDEYGGAYVVSFYHFP